GHKVYDRKEIKEILSYLNVLANPQDSISCERIVNSPKRGIEPGSIEKLRSFASLHEWPRLEADQNVDLSNIGGNAGQPVGA
ncbi:ATP-dependent DNA helicase PcrA, partial [Enterococcus lactis]|uniref:3'-5' exonuclease n=1 Tax=Enterococcus lactis TaxID=357441 RepID=UPI00237041DB